MKMYISKCGGPVGPGACPHLRGKNSAVEFVVARNPDASSSLPFLV
jgi:hypothetical protein